MVEITLCSQNLITLKKLLCLIEVTKLGRTVLINGNEVSPGTLLKTATELARIARNDFIIPETIIREDRSIIDFSRTANELKHMVETNDSQQILNKDDIHYKVDTVYFYSTFKNNFQERNKYWVDVRHQIASILDLKDRIFDMVHAYCQPSNFKLDGIKLPHLISLINAVMVVEYAFNLTEYGESVFDYKESPIVTGVAVYD